MWFDDEELLRFALEDLLGVTPDRCDALIERAAARPSPDRGRTLARILMPRAIAAGLGSGWSARWLHALPVALLEQRASMRHRAMLRACLRAMEDPTFFT